MIIVGLTGGIGSGKSTVARILETEGVPVYCADVESRRILNTDPQVIAAVKRLFGERAYTHGTADRAMIASVVFHNPEMLARLNEVMHPAVERDFLCWCSQQEANPYVIQESAILFESGFSKFMDLTVSVVAPIELRIARAMRRDKTTRETIAARIANQMNDGERIEQSDYVLYADDVQLLIPQVLELHRKLTAMSHP